MRCFSASLHESAARINLSSKGARQYACASRIACSVLPPRRKTPSSFEPEFTRHTDGIFRQESNSQFNRRMSTTRNNQPQRTRAR
eukprot:3941333-Rhodomonas_salina.2